MCASKCHQKGNSGHFKINLLHGEFGTMYLPKEKIERVAMYVGSMCLIIHDFRSSIEHSIKSAIILAT